MGKRHEAIGIKQAIRFEWMQKAANLLLAGLDAKTIRQELHEFLADRKGNGSEGERSDQTRTFVVNNLMKIWVSPDPELIPFRDASLAFLREQPSMSLAIHWGMISAVYPFWFNVARQTRPVAGPAGSGDPNRRSSTVSRSNMATGRPSAAMPDMLSAPLSPGEP